MAAINITSREQFGESQYLSKYSNQLVELMQPVALQANKDLYSYEYQAIANQAQAMLKSGELNSVQEAQAYVNDAFQMYLNPYQAMSTGNTMQKWTSINTYAQGGIDSPSAWLQNLVGNTRTAYSWAGGDTLTGSIIQNAFGGRNYRYINTNNSGKTEEILDNIIIKNNEDLADEFAKQIGLADNYNTNTQKVDTAIINATAILGDIKSIITDKGWAIGSVIVNGLITWMGAKIVSGSIGKLAGNLLGNGGSGGTGGLMGVLGAAATPATGILSATAVVALATAIGQAVVGSETTVTDTDFNSAKERLGENTTDIQANLDVGAGKSQAVSDNLLLNSITDKGITNAWGWAGNKISNAFRTSFGIGDIKDINKNLYENIFAENAMSAGNSDQETFKGLVLSYLLLLDSAGRLADAKDFGIQGDITREALKAEIKSGKYGSEDFIQKVYVNTLVDGGYAPYINYKDRQQSVTWENYHRYGLDEVPYDNYVASLHEGEAVLTASTANELRNLLDEYRANNESMASLDAIVQQQTSDLCAKIDEVINTVSGLQVGGYITSSAVDQSTARGLLKSSMIHMRSTKDALN